MNGQRLKFYTDKHIPKAVAIQLRTRGIDVVRCEEIGMGDAKDHEHLEYAAREERVLITRDEDFTRLNVEWQSTGKSHSGIFYCLSTVQGKAAVGKIVMACGEYDELISSGAGSIAEDIANRITHIR
jgi:hypothetical protein